MAPAWEMAALPPGQKRLRGCPGSGQELRRPPMRPHAQWRPKRFRALFHPSQSGELKNFHVGSRPLCVRRALSG
eukprot:scaffold7116_cov296-Pinguiococcus_pyrenoidosus.AAC.7